MMSNCGCTMMSWRAGLAGACLLMTVSASGAALAQGQPGGHPGVAPVQSAPRPASKAATAAKPAAKTQTETTDTARHDGSAQMRQRIEQLEEQINEMHVAVGTLESFAKTGAGRVTNAPIPAGGMPGDASARLDGMESKLRALSSQIDQMAQQIRALEGRGGRAPSDRGDVAPSMAGPPATRVTEVRPPERTPGQAPDRDGDGIGNLIRGPGNDRAADVGSTTLPPIGSGATGSPPRQQPASLTSGNPREVYERAYGSLLRQDYAAAEVGFTEFLAQFPSHELSGNAQYWLGESFYVRGQYKPAANAFLKGYQQFPKSQKGPDSLLKLGMSLERLGQRDAACSSISELASRFPSAPAHILSRAQSERARLGC